MGTSSNTKREKSLRYQGGKARQAKRIVAALGTGEQYLEPFLGGGSVASLVVPSFEISILADSSEDLVLFWQACLDGWRPPAEMSRSEYDTLKIAEPSALRAWAGYVVSRNGKWFSGYGPTATGRDYVAESLRSLNKKLVGMDGGTIVHQSYEKFTPNQDWVVYCDPPYNGRESYSAVDPFDTGKFWAVMDQWVDDGATVFVSEYNAPSHWRALDTWERSATLDPKKTKKGIESLYTRK